MAGTRILERHINEYKTNMKRIWDSKPVNLYKFAAASPAETIVFGSAKPGNSPEQLAQWLTFMTQQGIQRVCCLLPLEQLQPYPDLLAVYHQTFGSSRVLWAPIVDFNVVEHNLLLTQILPFLVEANDQGEKVLVHCSGGIGRTGQILVAWLIYGRQMDWQSAIATSRKMGRYPYEAVLAAPWQGRNPWQVKAQLDQLWQSLIPHPDKSLTEQL
jgi:protein-tyrosine phosphatase